MMSAGDHSQPAVEVRVPAELPMLKGHASRVLLAILVELTEVPIPEGTAERGPGDC